MTDLSKLHIDRDANRSAAPARRARRRWPWLVMSLAVIAAVLWYRSGGFTSVAELEIGVVTSAYPSAALTLFNATGYVVPQTKADIASKATGRLEALAVVEGSVVKKDQIIARLESADVVASLHRNEADVVAARASIEEARARRGEAQARVAESAAEVSEAQRALGRASKMQQRKFISDDIYDAALGRRDRALAVQASAAAGVVAAQASIAASEAQLNARRAAVEEARVAVEYTLIRAPFAGVVLSKEADIGDVLAPFAATTQSKGAVVTMADLDTLQVEVDIAESNLVDVQAGQPCEIQLDALPNVRLRGEVGMVVPTVDRTKATVMAKVRFLDRDPRVLPDMSARVAFLSKALDPAAQQPRTVVPGNAISSRAGRDLVFRLTGDHVEVVNVNGSAMLGELRVVGDALKPGEKIILNPSADLQDGARVRASAVAK